MAKENKIKQIKRVPKMNEAMWVLGIFLVALGVCMCKKADLGVSMIAAPTFIIFEAVKPLWSAVSVGTIEYLIQGAVLLLLCVIVQRFNWRYLLAFATAIIYGYVLDMWLLIFGAEPFDALWLRWVMLIVGDSITALGVACFFRTYMPLQVPELCVSEFADRYSLSINKVKWGYDLSFLALSLVLAFTLFGDVKSFEWSKIYSTSFHSVGLGTIITTLINAPIITFFGKVLDRLFTYEALFKPIEKLLARGKNPVPKIAVEPYVRQPKSCD